MFLQIVAPVEMCYWSDIKISMSGVGVATCRSNSAVHCATDRCEFAPYYQYYPYYPSVRSDTAASGGPFAENCDSPSPRYHLACNEFEVACIECFDEMVADVVSTRHFHDDHMTVLRESKLTHIPSQRPSDGLPLCPGSDCGKPLQSKLNIAQASFDKWIAQEKKSPSWKWDPNYPYHDRSVSTGKA